MEPGTGAMARRVDRRRSAWRPAVAAGLLVAGLVVVGRALVAEVGSPGTLLRALGDLGDAWADPVVSLLSLMALLAEALVGYVLVVLALRSLCLLPGSLGRIAGRVTLLVAPVVVRRLVDLLVGGTLLAQAALAVPPGTPSGDPPGVRHLALATSSASGGPAGRVTGSDLAATGPARRRALEVMEPVEARPIPRRPAVPLPPWLGGGPSTAAPRTTANAGAGPPAAAPRDTTEAEGGPSAEAPRYRVEAGDTLWDIAAAHLAPAERSVASIDRSWRQVYRANRPVIGTDPDLILPGTRLDVPPLRRDRR